MVFGSIATGFNDLTYEICAADSEGCTFERVEEFKYLGTTLTNQNFVQEEIKAD